MSPDRLVVDEVKDRLGLARSWVGSALGVVVPEVVESSGDAFIVALVRLFTEETRFVPLDQLARAVWGFCHAGPPWLTVDGVRSAYLVHRLRASGVL